MPIRRAAPEASKNPHAEGVIGGDESRTDRLIQAAAAQIAARGAAAASARSVAAEAGVSPSAINYNFGAIEQLLLAAYAQGVRDTTAWVAAKRRDLLALPRTANGAVLALEQVIVAWTGEMRGLALLYQESLAAMAGRGPAADWTALWREFWLQTADDFGLGAMDGRILHLFFESEALYHLSRWSPALEAAALREQCDLLGALWLNAAPGAATGAAALAERSAGARPVGSIAPAAMKIVEAAAEVVETGGLSGLTHRAVAARAGVTTGSVTHHFRTIEDLVAGAIRGQVEAMSRAVGEGPSPASPTSVEQIRSSADLAEALRFHAVADLPNGPALRRRTLFLAAVRRPELAGAGAVIRFAQGGTVRDALGRIFDLEPEALPLLAGVLARLLSPIWFACAADPDPRASREALADEVVRRLVGRLTVRGGA
jgi:AcrR family transcriptional regulator